jgi:hypothetical protein
MTAYVVDTNVAQVANEASPQAGPQCIQNCIDALTRARAGLVVIDDGMRILNEYLSTIGLEGQPGVGHIFVKWVFDNQAVDTCCERVNLTESTPNSSDFQEFPSDDALAGFDRSDRKFAAVAAASVNDPIILNAVDSDWWIYSVPLARNGLNVTFLCPSQFDGIGQVE